MDYATCSSIRSRLTTGFAAVSVGALVMTLVAVGHPAAPTPTVLPAVTLTAVTHPLQAPPLLMPPMTPAARMFMPPTTPAPAQPLMLPTTPAPAQPLASAQPLDLLAQQVSFHVTFVTNFLTTGAVLFGREFAIPGTLIQDINNGVPAPTAVGRALATFAQIELEAGGQLVNFAAQYVGFQLHFVANLVSMTIAAVGEVAKSLVAGLAPASATPTVASAGGSEAVPANRQSARHGLTSAIRSDEVTTAKMSATPGTVTQKPKQFRPTDAQSDSAISTTKSRHEDTSRASDQGGGDATSQDRSVGSRERSSGKGSSTSGGDRRAQAGNAGDQHQPKHEHHPKGDGNKGD